MPVLHPLPGLTDGVTAPSVEWPDHWSDEAVDAVETVLDAVEDLEGAPWAALMSVGELLTTASRLDDLARAAGYVSTGSTGQEILHPATAEARMTRTSATQLLVRLGAPAKAEQTRSQAGRSLARKRWEIR